VQYPGLESLKAERDDSIFSTNIVLHPVNDKKERRQDGVGGQENNKDITAISP